MKKTLYTSLILTLTLFSSTNFYQEGINFLEENNTKKATQSFIKSSEDGNAKAMYKLGLIYEKKQEHKKALIWYNKAKELGNIKAQYNLGVLGCKIKDYKYLNDFENYAKESTKTVQYDLAVCFSKKGDNKSALKWFKKVAKKGDAKAQYRVATLLKNKKSKIKWLRKSARNNHKEAQFELGKILFKSQQLKKAKYWLRKAKKNGSKKASVYLKRMKELGL
jgi:TPR repeat protein